MYGDMEVTIFVIKLLRHVSINPGNLRHFSSVIHGEWDISAELIHISAIQ